MPTNFIRAGIKRHFWSDNKKNLGLANLKLARHVGNSFLKSRCPTEDVIHNNSGTCRGVKNNTTVVGKVLRRRVELMYEDNENDRAIHRAKRHYRICIFRGVRSCKCQFALR